jgi:hypothetical protein
VIVVGYHGKLRTRGKLARKETPRVIRRVTGELAGLVEKTAAEAAAVLRNGRRALPRSAATSCAGVPRSRLAEGKRPQRGSGFFRKAARCGQSF